MKLIVIGALGGIWCSTWLKKIGASAKVEHLENQHCLELLEFLVGFWKHDQ